MFLYLPINPDPWAIGPLSIGKRGGKFFPNIGPNRQLVAFKEAVREELESQGVPKLPDGWIELDMYFFRRLDGKKHQADTTNCQKACEDALQDLLIGNDRDVARVRSTMVEQSADTEPGIILRADVWTEFDPHEIPDEIWDLREHAQSPTLFDNTWPPS